jgi:ATP:cob(I)alamin adenosyltransferase
MSIYTKTGDRGKTSLRSGSRVWKDSLRVDTYGTIDELNSYIGVICASMNVSSRNWEMYLTEILITIQQDLLYIGSALAQSEVELNQLDTHTEEFEQEIDAMTVQLPELSNFILPGGGVIGAHFQYGRTLVRRAERRVVTLAKKEEVDASLIRYINRLSDLFFTMGRFATMKEESRELTWIPHKPK